MIGPKNREDGTHIPLDIVGSSSFGRDPKILACRTFNMIQSDDWLVGIAGYQNVLQLLPVGNGRGLFTSSKSNSLVAVVSNRVFLIKIYTTTNGVTDTYTSSFIGQIDTFFGDCFIDENNASQIAICDQKDLWIYNYDTEKFVKAVLPDGFVPSYVTYQNGRFVISDGQAAQWALSNVGDGLNWFWGPSGSPVTFPLSTKASFTKGVLRFPGRGNLLLVIGDVVAELWVDVGAPIQPYQRSTSLNFDYGTINQATIATDGEIVAWLGYNEKSGLAIIYTNGSEIRQISTDGINFKFQQLSHPEKSSAFFTKLNGHLLYQITFYDPDDNYSLIYDFTTGKFYDATDEKQNYHIARRVSFFDNSYFFVSYNDGNLYRMDPNSYFYDYGNFQDNSPKIWEIPRIRIGSNFRLPDARSFSVANINFTLEQGNDPYNLSRDPSYQPRVALSMSKDGGISFGGYATRDLNLTGNRPNRVNWWNLGSANDFTYQIRFWGKGPWNAFNGVMTVTS